MLIGTFVGIIRVALLMGLSRRVAVLAILPGLERLFLHIHVRTIFVILFCALSGTRAHEGQVILVRPIAGVIYT